MSKGFEQEKGTDITELAEEVFYIRRPGIRQ